jgi:tetratricopeptide (TPR) repeat protein
MRIPQLRSGYRAFISYRRGTAGAEARLIKTALDKRGLRVFMDVTDLEKGYFDNALLERIAATPNFIVVLSPNSLDRCSDQGDWLRKEIACAVRTNRNIIPVMVRDFAFPLQLPEEIQTLPRYQGVKYYHEFFDSVVDKIASMIGIARPLWQRLLIPAPILALVLAGLLVRYIVGPKGPVAVPATPTEINLQQQALMFRNVKRFDDAVAKNKEIVAIHGALESVAAKEIADMEGIEKHEDSLIADGKSAESQNDLARAIKDYEDTVALHGPRELDAISSRDAVRQKMNGVSDAQIAQQSLNNGIAAFRRGEYDNARTLIDQSLSRSPDGWPQRTQAQDYSRKTANRLQQQQHLNRAQNYFESKNYSAAKNEANQVIATADGDSGFAKQAQDLIARIPAATPSSPANSPNTTQPPTPAPVVSPAVQGLLSEATGLVQQGQYKAAWDKAAALEKAGGDANTLRQNIRSAEDNKLQQLGLGYVGVNKQSRPDLQTLLTSVQQFANNTANKQSEANRYATQIANDIAAIDTAAAKPPAQPAAGQPSGVNPASPAEDAAAIQRTLDRYAQAVANGNLAAVKSVRQLTPTEERKMASSLAAMRGKGYSLRNCSHPEITSDSAQVTCEALLTRSKDAPSVRANFLLRKQAGQWAVVGTN